MKTSEAFQIWTKCVEKNEKEIEYLWVKKTWLYPNKRTTELYSHFVWYGATMLKTQQLKPYKR